NGGGYDQANNRLIAFFSDFDGSAIWILSNANGLSGPAVWTQLSTSGPQPVPHTSPGVVYDNTTNQLIVYGGCQASCGAPLPDVYVLSNANGLGGPAVWSRSTTNPPEPRDNQSVVYNTAHKSLISFAGGLAFFGTDQNDTRALIPANESNS